MSEVEVLTRELRWALTALGDELRSVGPAGLNQRPGVARANSPAVIVAHALAVTRAYVLGLGCGFMVDRDRPSEFETSYPSVEAAVADLHDAVAEVTNALACVPPGALDQMVVPDRQIWGTGELRVVARRECIVHALRHAALHLGELRLTAALLRAAT